MRQLCWGVQQDTFTRLPVWDDTLIVPVPDASLCTRLCYEQTAGSSMFHDNGTERARLHISSISREVKV